MPPPAISVVICTYNRARLLEQTLTALSAARLPAPSARVDVIVVDNNSTDDTRAVVRGAAARAPFPIRYDFEPRQGKSFALNRALALAGGDVVALTDDDVVPAPDWIARLAEDFLGGWTFVFGKVLPIWEVPPPPELLTLRARDIWGPLALVDYGDEPQVYVPAQFGRQRLPIGANLAVRREALVAVGGWRTDLGKVDNTLIAGEDHELCVRLHRHGLYHGLYDPNLRVRHLVPAARLTRRYFRRWFFWHGRTMARMMDAVYPELDLSAVPHVAGVPRFVYRQVLEQLGRWLRRAGRRDALELLVEELRLIDIVGLLYEARKRRGSRPPRASASDRAETFRTAHRST
ncbi:MAG TPA: glycosyltransferase [Vicinamibacterales bacterium]|nr:glycosyltransferase [Vicinamibacterales bacterium]